MADSKPKPSAVPVTLSPADLHNLADRLSERAATIENVATQDLANDLRLVSRVLTALLASGVIAEDIALSTSNDRKLGKRHD